MALTPWRWLALAVAGALIATGYFLGTSARELPQPHARELIVRQEREMNLAASRAADHLRIITLADSTSRALGFPAATDSIRVIVGGGVPAALHDPLRQLAARAVRNLGGAVRNVDVAFVLDTVRVVRGVGRHMNQWVMPTFVIPSGPGERCLVLNRLDPHRHAPRADRLAAMARDLDDRRLLGPCAFVAAFGQPGPHVARWLLDGGWSFSLFSDWSRPSPAWTLPTWYTARAAADGFPLRHFMSTNGYRCVTGEGADCVRAVLATDVPGRGRYPDIWGDRFVSAASLRHESWYRLSLGPSATSFLSDMVRTVGPERFRALWTSNLPFPEAFEAATGTDLGEHTHGWAARKYDGYAGRGPALPRSTVPAGLGVIGAGVVVAMFAVRRREAA